MPYCGAEEPHVERLHDRAEVALVGGHERPVGQHREAVRLLQHERRDLDGPAARHLLAHRHARIDGLERRRLGRRRGRRAGPRWRPRRCRRAWRRRLRSALRARARSRPRRPTSSTSRGALTKLTGWPGAHDDQVGAGRGGGHEAEVLDGRDEVEGVVGVELGVGRQHVDLALEVEQAGQVANGRGHRLPGVRDRSSGRRSAAGWPGRRPASRRRRRWPARCRGCRPRARGRAEGGPPRSGRPCSRPSR